MRRKLIVSYLFIGFVPVLLVIAFFLVSGTLLFLNVSAYVLRNRIATVVDQTQFLAQTAAIEVQRAQNEREVADTLARRQVAAVRRYPLVSYAVVRAMGRLTTKLLALNVAQYRAKEHFDQVKDLWYGVRTPDGR